MVQSKATTPSVMVDPTKDYHLVRDETIDEVLDFVQSKVEHQENHDSTFEIGVEVLHDCATIDLPNLA